MATSELSAWDGWRTSQLMIVLLGGRNSGKSSLGNLLLGKEEFVTKERTSCSRRLGLVDGRWLTVVDTPGWWCDFSVQDTSELVKREILSSVSLCSPGPHVFLITVKATSVFSEKRRRAVEEHVSMLGERVWDHCMIVFTSADGCERTVAEEHIETGGQALCWLKEKCRQRCHSVILREDSDVKELMEKIQKLVSQNGNRAFRMEKILQVATEEKRGVEERAQLRFMRVKQQRTLMRDRLRPMTDIRIVLLGAKGSGKTSALNTILSRETSQSLKRTARCLVGKGVVFGRQVTVVDTPGWWMNYFCDESSVFDRREMVLSLSLCPPGPHAFLLVIRVDRAFTETYRRAVQAHLQLLSDHIWSRTIVLFSFGDWLGGTTSEQYIESEREPLRWLVERCGNRYHVLNNKTKGDGFQVRELIGKIEEMLAGCGSGWYYEIERKVMERLHGEMRREEERAKGRLMKKEKQRQMARTQLEKLCPLPEMRTVLVGGRKTGKSSCGNTILNRECFETDTQTSSCTEKRGKIGDKMVTVLDTPGGFSVTPELLMPSCAVLLVVNVSSAFKQSHWEAVEKQLGAGGGQLWRRAVVLFSHGDWLGNTSIEQRIECEGELLQKLVDECGNRYHVLDNKHRADGAQVAELVELMEEMLVGERLAVLHRGDPLWKSVSSGQARQPEAGVLGEKDFKELMIHTCHLSGDLTGSATSSSRLSLNRPEDPDAAGKIVALSPRGAGGRRGRTHPDRDGFAFRLASLLSGREGLWWSATVNLPVWLPAGNPHGRVRLFSPRHPTMLPVSPQTQDRMIMVENAITVHSLSHPALREQTLRRLDECGGLQALIDQWGDSSLEELEAFIDSYFEMVWEQTMGSCQTPESSGVTTEQDAVAEAAREEEVLSSIDRKLSKLELLEEIRKDLAKLRESLEHSWKAIQELRDRGKQDANNIK